VARTTRVIFLLDVIAGPRRGEVLGFHWPDVDLAEPTGAVLRIRETWVRSTKDTPKSEAGERAIPLGPWLAEELWQHRRRTSFTGDDERVFCSPTKGTPFDVTRYATTLRAVLKPVGIDRPIRPFHDLRHTAITNDAAAGNSPVAIMKHAGHTDFKTTQRYIDLAGITFREEAERAELRLLGQLPAATE
jgi:integrase